ncbi:hypothetical protein [Photobacterium damselae]|uniref:Uncharacterized protein n=1 Tax=Photobacterium damselae subsp. damselae TaxID=85581 RepID=A0AAD3ZVB2_PHODD|nr:hypothetical protein [Photobacterium damselae]KAB1179969.1 hypothetical protein F6450_12355 [Photobacterium damselae subsp. damselae]
MGIIQLMLSATTIATFITALLGAPIIGYIQTLITNRSQLNRNIIQALEKRNKFKQYELEILFGCPSNDVLKAIMRDRSSNPVDTIKHMLKVYPYYKSPVKKYFFNMWLNNISIKHYNIFVIFRRCQFAYMLLLPIFIYTIYGNNYNLLIDFCDDYMKSFGLELILNSVILISIMLISFGILKFYYFFLSGLYFLGWNYKSIVVFHKFMGEKIETERQKGYLKCLVTMLSVVLAVGCLYYSAFADSIWALLITIIAIPIFLIIELLISIQPWKDIDNISSNSKTEIKEIKNSIKEFLEFEQNIILAKFKENKENKENKIG